VKHPNVDLYVDTDALARYEYYPLDNRAFKEQIFSQNKRMNTQTMRFADKKIKYFQSNDALIPNLVKAYAQHLADNKFMQETYDLHTFLLTDSTKQDAAAFLTNKVQESPLSAQREAHMAHFYGTTI